MKGPEQKAARLIEATEDVRSPGTPKIDMTEFGSSFVKTLLDTAGLDNPLESTAKDVMAWPKDPIAWIETHFWVPELKGPLKIFPYQRAALKEAYRKDKNGNFIYDTVVWSDIKKSLKSVIAAAVVAERARHVSWGQFRLIGNSREQAASRSFYYLQRAIKLNPALRKTVVSRQYTILYPNRTQIQAIPMNPNSQAGGNDSMIIYTETWAADPAIIERMFIEMTIPPNLYGRAQRWLESYAGYSGVSTLLERLYRTGVKEGELLDVGFPGLELYANKEAKLLVLWNTVPRLPWQTAEYYCLPLPENKQELRVLTAEGWLPAEDVTHQSLLATRDSEGVIQYQNPTHIFNEEYSGELFRLKTAQIDFTVTPNHRVLAQYIPHMRKYEAIRNEKPIYEYRTANDASLSHAGFVPNKGIWIHDPLEWFCVEDERYNGTDWVEFLAWYLAEGHVQIDKRNKKWYSNSLVISQDRYKNKNKHNHIIDLCLRMGLRPKSKRNGIHIYNSRLARYMYQFGKSHQKRIPRYILEGCSREQLKVFLNAYLAGDGTLKVFSAELYTNSDGMRDDLMELIFKVGYSPRYHGSYSSAPEKGRFPVHHIGLVWGDFGWSRFRKHWSKFIAPEGTRVWCPTLPNGNFYVSVKGKCFWTGNSQEAKILAPNEFQRVHRNQWVSASREFVPKAWWEACKQPLPKLDAFEQVIIGVDAAVSSDSFGVVAVSRHGDTLAVREAREWKPVGGKIEFTNFNNPSDPDYPEGFIRMLADKYNAIALVYDPYQLEHFCSALTNDNVVWCKPMNQGPTRAIADKQLYDLIRNRSLIHDGNSALDDHINNADSTADGSDKLRLVKRSRVLKIDLAVALSMACKEALELLAP